MKHLNWDALRAHASHFEQRRQRAEARLKKSPHVPAWYFGIIGLESRVEHVADGDQIIFQRVHEPPGEVELARALRKQTYFGAVGRYAHHITHELVLPTQHWDSGDFACTGAWWILSLLRIRTGSDFLVPVVADRSWSTMAAVSDNSCEVEFIEDVPTRSDVGPARQVVEEDVKWAMSTLQRFSGMIGDPALNLAVGSYGTSSHSTNLRAVAATIWTGIEALCGVEVEIRFRLSMYIAALLEPLGPDRLAKYRECRTLYDVRSKIVHGSKLTQAKPHAHVIASRELLRAMIEKIIERGSLPTKDEYDEMLLK